MSIPLTVTENFRLLLSIPAIVVKALELELKLLSYVEDAISFLFKTVMFSGDTFFLDMRQP